jgi:uncharacterized protein DUF6529
MRFDCAVAATAPTPSPAPATRSTAWLALPLAIFAVVALTVGLLARSFKGGTKGYFDLFFSDPIHLKAWFATAAVLLACTQLFTAAWIFRKLYWPRPPWINVVHRWTGRLTFLCTLPVAYHCVYKLGFQTYSDRVLLHSLLGSAFFGGYFAKVTIVRLHRFPRWVLPVAGGTLFTILILVWYTSALWFFRQVGEGI